MLVLRYFARVYVYLSTTMRSNLASHGTLFQKSTTNTDKQNNVVKCKHYNILDIARPLLFTFIPRHFWVEKVLPDVMWLLWVCCWVLLLKVVFTLIFSSMISFLSFDLSLLHLHFTSWAWKTWFLLSTMSISDSVMSIVGIVVMIQHSLFLCTVPLRTPRSFRPPL